MDMSPTTYPIINRINSPIIREYMNLIISLKSTSVDESIEGF
jgi:hypothetical protein